MIIVKDVLAVKGSSVFTISPQAKVNEALTLMADKEIGAIVVVSDGRVVGVISERDYARKVILQGLFCKDVCVSDIMSTDCITVTMSQTVEECLSIMTEKRHRHLPVMDNGKLVGLVSIGDLVKIIITDQRYLIENLETYITGVPAIK